MRRRFKPRLLQFFFVVVTAIMYPAGYQTRNVTIYGSTQLGFAHRQDAKMQKRTKTWQGASDKVRSAFEKYDDQRQFGRNESD